MKSLSQHLKPLSMLTTHLLAQETLKRADDVWDVNERAFVRCGVAFAAFAIPTLVATFFTMDTRIVFGCGFIFSAAPVAWWILALRDCSRYAREMNARTAELNRRAAPIDRVPA